VIDFLKKVVTAFKIVNMMQVQQRVCFNDLHSRKGVKPHKPDKNKACLYNNERFQSPVPDEILISG